MKYMTLFSPKKITENWRFYSKAFRIKQLIYRYRFCIALMDNLPKTSFIKPQRCHYQCINQNFGRSKTSLKKDV